MEGSVLGFDYGLARIGVAVGNTVTRSARPETIVKARTNVAKWSGIESLVKSWNPVAIVVGLPRHPDGTAHEVTRLAARFARQIGGRFSLPVYVVDERYSSVVVENGENKIDDAAAAVILQQWFDEGMPERYLENMK